MLRPVVDLPHPLSPTRPRVSPLSTREGNVVDGVDVPDLLRENYAALDREILLEVGDLDEQRFRRHAAWFSFRGHAGTPRRALMT